MSKIKFQKGFTLIELLVVIAIIAILSVVVILTLNPAELLRQARDSNRISDLSTLKTALGAYYADVSSPTSSQSGSLLNCGEYNVLSAAAGANCGFPSSTYLTITSSTSRAVDGTGWLSIPFTSISAGAPIGNLPVDPTNSGTSVYRYAPSSSFTYEVDALMESTKQSGATGAAQTDGGNSPTLYEIGTVANLGL